MLNMVRITPPRAPRRAAPWTSPNVRRCPPPSRARRDLPSKGRRSPSASHGSAPAANAHAGEVVLFPEDELPARREPGLLHGSNEERVDALAAILRTEVVRALEVDGIDLLVGDEDSDVD